MSLAVGVLCSEQSLELAALLTEMESGRLNVNIKAVVADRDSAALTLARNVGLYGVFVPRAAFHANRDGFERRLVELFQQAEAEVVVLAGYEREVGHVLKESFLGRVYGLGLDPEELVDDLEARIRMRGTALSLVP